MIKTQSFAIIGAGIGGLTLAIALQRKGFNVTVYENAATIKPLGAGLGLAGNAVKAFMEIGISEEILRAGRRMKKIAIKNESGKILTETDSEKISAKYGIIHNFTIHRADLHEILLSLLKPNTVKLGKRCVDFKQSKSDVTLYFEDGSSVVTNYVLAADGIHSIFRKKLLPQSLPRYAGYTCWRAVINNIPEGVDVEETSETWGPGCRFGIVPLTDNRLYWFACINAPRGHNMKDFSVAQLGAYFKNFHKPVPQIINNTSQDQLIWGDIVDLEPINRFAFDNIVLMGDAAHATTPNLGQGACMAIEDAVVLANYLESYYSGEEAFKQFEIKRIERTTRIVKESWILGKIAQLENPLLRALRDGALRITPPRLAEKQIKFLQEVSFH